MKRSVVLFTGLLLALLATVTFFSSSRDGAPPVQKLSLVGSSTVAPLAAEIARRYEQQHPGVEIDVQTGGSGRGINEVRRALADIGMVSRALNAAEADLHPYPIARDGLGIIVHADNPLTHIRHEQVVQVFTGAITSWRELGAGAAPITVVNKAEGRATLELFLNYFQLKNSRIRPQVIVGDNEQGIKVVAGNPAAIGYVSIGVAEHDIAAGTPIKLLALDGVAASRANVASGRYPLARSLNLVTRAPARGLARDFIDYARSNAVHDLVAAQHFLPLVP
ncbi:MAG TPA: phosphate ABC transporter substrate-binding protein [Gammaproteobacteria bacterium]|nr:phosphate ABC transporter substrate-binding protein [Gammaproteobacteria bacterium]